MDDYKQKFISFITNRIVILVIIILGCFYILIAKLFSLQIVNGEAISKEFQANTIRELPVQALRGNIYDRNGKVMAYNKSSKTVMFDPSIVVVDINRVFYDLILVLQKNNEEYALDLPITRTKPYEFMLDDNEKKEIEFKRSLGVDDGYTAEQTLDYLAGEDMFDIPTYYSEQMRYDIISLRSSLYQQRYRKYNPLPVAYDVSYETIAYLEENNVRFPGVYTDDAFLRVYPLEKYVAHMIGYTGKINSTELENYEKHGYTNQDVIGKTGLERSLEMELRGEDGKMEVEVNSTGRRVNTVNSVEAKPGNDIYLTIDSDLQKKAYDILEEKLTQIIINKMTRSSAFRITPKMAMSSLVEANNISIKDLFEAGEGTTSAEIKRTLLASNPQLTAEGTEGVKEARELFAQLISDGKISINKVFLVMVEQGIITADEKTVNRLKTNSVNNLNFLIEKLNSREITPQMLNLDPCSGSVVVTDVNTGEVIVAVGYPSFDNNQFANVFNNEYYYKLYADPTLPQTNRPFMEPRAPGSTFKMITAMAGLESGVITADTRIRDEVSFEKAGKPFVRCWSSVSHGSINVKQALEVSCNYFFAEVAYRMGNSKEGTTLEGINTLNKYMIDFGLNDRTGVEVGELADFTKTNGLDMIISSPEYKEYIEKMYNENVTEQDLKWYDGDTVGTSIGQYKNNYTAASMAKYIATLANGGTRYQLHLLDEVKNYEGDTVEKTLPIVEKELDYKKENYDVIYQGMLSVTTGSRGTARNIFKDFPITVGGKTGTAQENKLKPDHTSFGGFAPFDSPEVSVYVVIPFGDTPTTPAAATQVAKEVLTEYYDLNSEILQNIPTNSLIR